MIVAGHETTLDLLTNAVCALLTYPDQLALVLGGQHPWTAVIEETLRWDSPLGHLPMRYATEDVIIGGTVLPKGQAILAPYVTAGRCPVYFGETADRFDITRPPKRHVMFGHGPHLPRLEAEVALLALFARFPNLAMAAPVDNPHADPVDRQQLREDAPGDPGAVTWMGNSPGEVAHHPLVTRG